MVGGSLIKKLIVALFIQGANQKVHLPQEPNIVYLFLDVLQGVPHQLLTVKRDTNLYNILK